MNLREHIKRTETTCNHLQVMDQLQTEINIKIHALDELASRLTDNIDQDRFLAIVQVR